MNPPLLFLLGLLAALLLHAFVPQPGLIPTPFNLAGLLFLLGGFALILHGGGLFLRHGASLRPTRKPSQLVTTGAYRLSRNPIYLGMFLALVGVAVLLGTPFPWLVPPFFAIALSHIITGEEAVLEETFGEAWHAYRDKVRRWL